MKVLTVKTRDVNVPPRRRNTFGPLWLVVPGVVFLAAFLLYPSLKLLSLSFVGRDGALTMSAFGHFLGPSVYRRVLQSTFAIALETTLACLAFGYPLAYWLASLPKRRQQLLALLVLLAFWTSALVKNFSWMVLLGRNGFAEHVLEAVGIHGMHLLFNRGIVVFAMAHTLLPLAVVTMLPVMNQSDRRLVMAAATLGADRAEAFWRVFFVDSMRGVAAAGLLVFISALGYFITPTLLGSPHEEMLGQLIILQINQLQNWQLGSALAVVLVLSALLCCLLYNLIFGLSSLAGGSATRSSHQRFFRAIGMAAVSACARFSSRLLQPYDRIVRRHMPVSLLSLYACCVIAVLLFPIVAIVPMAFTHGSFLTFPPQGWSLQWFDTYFSSSMWIGATLRSFGIGLVVAAITTVVATMAALGIARSSGKLASAAFLLFLTPMIVPTIVIAIALFYFCAHFSLVATNTGIVLGHIVIAMPMVFVILLTTFKGHDWQLDHAAATLGANRWQVLWRVTLPSIRNGIAAAFVIGFLSSFEELTIAMFIGGGIKTTLPKQIWDDILLQVSPTLAAASTVVLCVVTLLFALLQVVRPGGRSET